MLAAFLLKSQGPNVAKVAPDADALKRTREEADTLTETAKDGFSEFKTCGLSIFAVLEDMAATNNTSSLSMLSKEACLGCFGCIRMSAPIHNTWFVWMLILKAILFLVDGKLV